MEKIKLFPIFQFKVMETFKVVNVSSLKCCKVLKSNNNDNNNNKIKKMRKEEGRNVSILRVPLMAKKNMRTNPQKKISSKFAKIGMLTSDGMIKINRNILR